MPFSSKFLANLVERQAGEIAVLCQENCLIRTGKLDEHRAEASWDLVVISMACWTELERASRVRWSIGSTYGKGAGRKKRVWGMLMVL
jgi:hypothetical protein